MVLGVKPAVRVQGAMHVDLGMPGFLLISLQLHEYN